MKDPIFIMSLRPRSGTNILCFHLHQHPDVRGCSLYEDYFIAHISHLNNFIGRVGRSQKHLLESARIDQITEDLRFNLACGLKDILYAPVNRYLPILDKSGAGNDPFDSKILITKSPTVEGLEYIFDFFPKSKVLILLRDPRDIIESEMKAFNFEFRSLVVAWRDAARLLLSFLNNNKNLSRCKLVRYEGLCENPRSVVHDTLSFLGLDINSYDFSKIEKAPVIGCSDDLAKGDWTYKEKSKDFNSIGKWHRWHAQRLTYYDRVAGKEAHSLGYR